MQNEPGVCAAFPDPAVGNDVFVPVQAAPLYSSLSSSSDLKVPSSLAALLQGTFSCGNVPAALCLLLRQVGWGKQPAGVLVGAAHIDKTLAADCRDHLVAEGADIEVGLSSCVARGRSRHRFAAEVARVQLHFLRPPSSSKTLSCP